jgi:hypothetical protein
MLAASPVVPAPEGEAVAWRWKTLGQWAYTDRTESLEMVRSLGESPEPLYTSPVVPVGVSREEIADKVYRILRHSDRRPSPDHGLIPPMDTGASLAIADAILAALRPTDTGRE